MQKLTFLNVSFARKGCLSCSLLIPGSTQPVLSIHWSFSDYDIGMNEFYVEQTEVERLERDNYNQGLLG